MRPGPPQGAARAGARGGVAPALLLDLQTPSGETLYFSDRSLMLPPVIPPVMTGRFPPHVLGENVEYWPWLMGVGSFTFNRSLQTDTGKLSLQNVSGTVLVRDFERIATAGSLEGSLFVLRYYQVDLEWPWIEQHGTISLAESRDVVQLTTTQLLDGQDDTPVQLMSETCQLNWGYPRCGATGSTECLYTYASCQVPNHFVGITTAFEVNNPDAAASLPVLVINRKKAW